MCGRLEKTLTIIYIIAWQEKAADVPAVHTAGSVLPDFTVVVVCDS